MPETQPAGIPGLHIHRVGGGSLEFFQGTGARENGFSIPLLTGFGSMHSQATDGQLCFQYYLGRDFQIWYSGYAFKKSVQFISRGDMSVLELHIPLETVAESWWDGRPERQAGEQQFDLSYAPFVNNATTFTGGRRYYTFDVHYSFAYLERFATIYPQLHLFLEQVTNKQRADLLHTLQFLDPAMMAIVRSMIHYNGPREMAAYFYEAQVFLLLQSVLERTLAAPIVCTKYDKASVMQVHDLLVQSVGQTFTMQELAQYTGINVSRLHKCFKQLYGVTIFDFAQTNRMGYAKQLLRDTRQTLQDIAEACGYTEHANFTTAFKKQFGYTPEYYRKQVK